MDCIIIESPIRILLKFLDLPYEECKFRLLQAEQIFKTSGVRYVRNFHPPGWGISDGLFKALKDLDYAFISLDSMACKVDLDRYRVAEFKELMNISQNWDMKHGEIGDAIKILENGDILSVKGHIQDRYLLSNGLPKKSYRNVRNLLLKIEEEVDVKYAKMEEIAEDFNGVL